MQMNYSTFDRFQGAWLGSMMGLAIGSHSSSSEQSKIFGLEISPWLKTREKIAQTIVETQDIRTSAITEQLILLLQKTCSQDSKAIAGIVRSKLMLALLPLILFQSPPQLYAELIEQCNSLLGKSPEIEQDILLWNYLLSSILYHPRQLGNLNHVNSIEQILVGVEVKSNCLLEQLEIVSKAWLRGFSLKQVTEQLGGQSKSRVNNASTKSLIPLSLYCFAATPNDFILSVKRAASLDENLSPIIAALTATLSGAYNGVARLPLNWRTTANHNRVYQQAQKTIAILLETWLGVENPAKNRKIIYDPQINAVAVPQIIQPRPSLKIISQKSNLS